MVHRVIQAIEMKKNSFNVVHTFLEPSQMILPTTHQQARESSVRKSTVERKPPSSDGGRYASLFGD